MQPRVVRERRRFSMIQFGLRLHDAEKLPVNRCCRRCAERLYLRPCGSEQILQGAALHPQRPDPGYALHLRHLFEKNGIDIAVLGNYLNLAHPDARMPCTPFRKNTMPISALQSLLGCGMVGTETGALQRGVQIRQLERRSDEALATFELNFKPVETSLLFAAGNPIAVGILGRDLAAETPWCIMAT